MTTENTNRPAIEMTTTNRNNGQVTCPRYTGRQTIITKYHGPTNTKGAKMSAKCNAGTITIPYYPSFSVDKNHEIACGALLQKLAWCTEGVRVGGYLPDDSMVFVCVEA